MPDGGESDEESVEGRCTAVQLSAPGSMATADTGPQAKAATRRLRVLRRSGAESRLRLIVGPSGRHLIGVARRSSARHAPLTAFSSSAIRFMMSSKLGGGSSPSIFWYGC